ncbi:MAG: orotate phosphoribosyltransferase [Anaerolineae bacterium]|nr:orotate phosphoribosyltransferase [Anaerolineae bacterium]
MALLLESGLHAETWIDLDALFVDPKRIEPNLAALTALIGQHDVTAICGPLLGGAFVAQAIASRLGLRFFFTERVRSSEKGALYQAVYRLPHAQRGHIAGERVAVVDDVISAGSSVRATVAELEAAGASVHVVGALLLLGNKAADHFSTRQTPVVAPATRAFEMWEPAHCPHCQAGKPLQIP